MNEQNILNNKSINNINTYNFEIKSEYDKKQFKKLHELIQLAKIKKILLFFCGMPSAGKTVLIKKILKDNNNFTYISKLDLLTSFNNNLSDEVIQSDKDTSFDKSNLLNNNFDINKIIQDLVKNSKTSCLIEVRNLNSTRNKNLIYNLRNYEKYFIYINCPLKIILERNDQKLVNNTNLPDFTLKYIYRFFSLPVIDIILNVYEKETSYTPKFKSADINTIKNDKETDVKIKMHALYNMNLNNIEQYRASYKISYIRDKSAKEKLLSLYQLNEDNIEDYIHSLDWDQILPIYKICINYNQNTKYHLYSLHKHMYKSAFIAKEKYNADQLIFLALFFHDIGKPYTMVDVGRLKEDTDIFKKNEKIYIKQGKNGLISAFQFKRDILKEQLLLPAQIEANNCSHFYGHESLGAILLHQQLSLLNFSIKELNLIYRYISNHMIITSSSYLSSSVLRKIKFFNKDILNELYIIHKSDAEATGFYNQHDIDVFNENYRNLLKIDYI